MSRRCAVFTSVASLVCLPCSRASAPVDHLSAVRSPRAGGATTGCLLLSSAGLLLPPVTFHADCAAARSLPRARLAASRRPPCRLPHLAVNPPPRSRRCAATPVRLLSVCWPAVVSLLVHSTHAHTQTHTSRRLLLLLPASPDAALRLFLFFFSLLLLLLLFFFSLSSPGGCWTELPLQLPPTQLVCVCMCVLD